MANKMSNLGFASGGNDKRRNTARSVRERVPSECAQELPCLRVKERDRFTGDLNSHPSIVGDIGLLRLPRTPTRVTAVQSSCPRSHHRCDRQVPKSLELKPVYGRPTKRLRVVLHHSPQGNAEADPSKRLTARSSFTWFGIVTLFTTKLSPGGFLPWGFVTGLLHPARHGKTGMRNG